MTYAIIAKGTKNESHAGFVCISANWLAVGRLTAHRIQEFAQGKDDEVLMYILPNGETVVHAFTRNNVVLFDEHDGKICGTSKEERDKVVII